MVNSISFQTIYKKRCLGNLVIEDDRVVQQLFPGGYFDTEGNAYYYLTDYQGNVTGVIDSNAKIVQETGYYPYGEPWLEPEGDNPYLYGGKERVALGGVRYSDFGPRLLSTASGYWGSPDPLCEDFRDLSSYINCAANPVRFSDPSGQSPVYNIKGDSLGCTKEGFTGRILIYSGEDKFDPSNFTADELLRKNGVDIYDNYADPESDDMSADAHSKILTSVVSHFEGMEVLGDKFSMSDLRGGRIRYEKGDFNWQTRYYKSGPAGIFNSGIKGYEATVENIASSVIVHEWYSHIVEGVGDITNDHSKAYFNVLFNNLLGCKITQSYTNFNIEKYNLYFLKELLVNMKKFLK